MPHNLISSQEIPVPLINFQMAPRLKISMASGSKKETKYTFLLKVLANKPPSGSTKGPLWGEIPVYRAICISLKNLIFRVSQ
jgi:hypothetical protein